MRPAFHPAPIVFIILPCTTNSPGRALRYGRAAGNGKAPGQTVLLQAAVRHMT
jgi:hypothetical protein